MRETVGLPAQQFEVEGREEAEKSGQKGYKKPSWQDRELLILFPILWRDLIYSPPKAGLLFMTKHHILFMLV